MILDKAMEISAAQAVTVDAASSKCIDLGPPSYTGMSNGHTGEPIALLVTVDETVTADGAATVTLQVRSSASADMSSPVVHFQSAAIPKASLTAGAKVPFMPFIPLDAKRYVDVYFDVGTGPLTAGKFTIRGAAARDLALGA